MTDEFASEAGSGDGALSVRVYVNLLLKYLWLIALLGAVGGGAGYYYGQQQPEVYEARSMVLIDLDSPQILQDVMPVVDNTPSSSFWAKREYMETQLRVVRSRAIAERVSERLDLPNDREFLGLADVDDPAELERALAAAGVRTSRVARPF